MSRANPVLFFVALALTIGFNVYENSMADDSWEHRMYFVEAVDDLKEWKTAWLSCVTAFFAIGWYFGYRRASRDSYFVAFFLALSQACYVRYDNASLKTVVVFATFVDLVLLVVACNVLVSYISLLRERSQESEHAEGRRYGLMSQDSARKGLILSALLLIGVAVAQIGNFFNTEDSLADDSIFDTGMWNSLITGSFAIAAGLATWVSLGLQQGSPWRRLALCSVIVWCLGTSFMVGSQVEYFLFSLANNEFFCDCEITEEPMSCPFDVRVARANVALNILQIGLLWSTAFLAFNLNEHLQSGIEEHRQKPRLSAWTARGDHSLGSLVPSLQTVLRHAEKATFGLFVLFLAVAIVLADPIDIESPGSETTNTTDLAFLSAFTLVLHIALVLMHRNPTSVARRATVTTLALYIVNIYYHELLGMATQAKYGTKNPPSELQSTGYTCLDLEEFGSSFGSGSIDWNTLLRPWAAETPTSLHKSYVLSTVGCSLGLVTAFVIAIASYSLEEADLDAAAPEPPAEPMVEMDTIAASQLTPFPVAIEDATAHSDV